MDLRIGAAERYDKWSVSAVVVVRTVLVSSHFHRRAVTFHFWQRWLFAASVAFAAFGVFVATFPFAAPFAPRNAAIAATFFDGRWSDAAAAYHAFSAGPLGGTIAGFYVLQAFIAAVPFRRRERWAWHAIVWGTLLWFVVDSAVSVWHGAAFNVWLVNVVPVAVFGAPLVATYRAFSGGADGRRPSGG